MSDPETLTRYIIGPTGASWAYENDCGEWVSYTDHLAALTAERARADQLAHDLDALREELRQCQQDLDGWVP